MPLFVKIMLVAVLGIIAAACGLIGLLALVDAEGRGGALVNKLGAGMIAALLGIVAVLAIPTAAAAREVGSARAPGVGIVLFDDRADCPAGAARALWVQAEGKVPGCWFERHERIWLFWDDGDHHGIPRQAFRFEAI